MIPIALYTACDERRSLLHSKFDAKNRFSYENLCVVMLRACVGSPLCAQAWAMSAPSRAQCRKFFRAGLSQITCSFLSLHLMRNLLQLSIFSLDCLCTSTKNYSGWAFRKKDTALFITLVLTKWSLLASARQLASNFTCT